MIPVLWTVDPLDWCSDDVACITSNVVNIVEENDIILMHDYYESSVTAALKIVDRLLKEGYVFVTVEEILFE
jgi:peptidoglycan/xylan/chitin deacetylase (PgdA/CDA1 family)